MGQKLWIFLFMTNIWMCAVFCCSDLSLAYLLLSLHPFYCHSESYFGKRMKLFHPPIIPCPIEWIQNKYLCELTQWWNRKVNVQKISEVLWFLFYIRFLWNLASFYQNVISDTLICFYKETVHSVFKHRVMHTWWKSIWHTIRLLMQFFGYFEMQTGGIFQE